MSPEQWKIVLYNFIEEYNKNNIDAYLSVCAKAVTKETFQEYISKLDIDNDKFVELTGDGNKLNNSKLSDTINNTQDHVNKIKNYVTPNDSNDINKQKYILTYILNNKTLDNPKNNEIDTQELEKIAKIDDIFNDTYNSRNDIITILECIKKHYLSLLNDETDYLTIYENILAKLNDRQLLDNIITSIDEKKLIDMQVQLTNINIAACDNISIDEIIQAILEFNKNNNTQKFVKAFFNTLQQNGFLSNKPEYVIPRELYSDPDDLIKAMINFRYNMGDDEDKIIPNITAFFENVNNPNDSLKNIYSMIKKILQKKKDEDSRTVINKNINVNQTEESVIFFKDMPLFEEETSSDDQGIEITDKDIENLVDAAKKEKMDLIDYCEQDQENNEEQTGDEQLSDIDISDIVNNARNTKIVIDYKLEQENKPEQPQQIKNNQQINNIDTSDIVNNIRNVKINF